MRSTVPSRGGVAAVRTTISSCLLLLLALPLHAQEKRSLTFTDLMQIRQVENPSISADGRWIAFTAEPDRGDPEVIVRSTTGDTRWVVPRGSNPVISTTGAFVAARLNPSLEARETAGRGDAPRRGMAVLATDDGTVDTVPDVQSFAFSDDGRWLAYQRFAPRPDPEDAEAEDQPRGDREPGTLLVLRELASGSETGIPDVRSWAMDDASRHLAYAVASADNARDGLYVRELGAADGLEATVHATAFGHYESLTWTEDGASLAFVASVEDEDGEAGRGTVMAWRGAATSVLVDSAAAPEGWMIPASSELRWSDDGARLFLGWRPLRADEMETDQSPEQADADAEEEAFDPYDVEAILDERGVDVWHWQDPRIMPQQKVLWEREKDRTYLAVHHLADGRTVALGDPEVPDVSVPGNARVALARSDVPYRRAFTWAGGRSDLYVVDLETGARTPVARALTSSSTLSPGGRFVAWFDDGDWYLYDVEAASVRNVTERLGVPFANEDHDTPDEPGGYGVGAWAEGDRAAFVYDKFDIWVVPTDGSDPWMLTQGEGRREHRQFRIVDTDPDVEAIPDGQRLLLSSYHDLQKNEGFWRATAGRPEVTRLLEEERLFGFVAKAENADRYLYTREDYDEFPDLWVARPDFADARKVTDVNPNLDEFAWGTSELVEWLSLDGTPLQGVVIKPGNYDPSRRYPVLVYYYELFSQRLHEFNEPAVNHRPSFPLYASNGYVVFLPDVRFDVGEPGFSATKAVVPGVQHLIDIGLADPDAMALHGHSWSGYQTAFVVTQTDIFKTAIAGAPVANMTSAYSGIRLGSGLARQFQYEQGQSRLSGSLWEARDEYIDNSPVFFADRIHTPLLILHGNVDDAVPWEQAIELYLALRRLDKEAVFLEYRDEPHHPQRYANKLDWSIKMKEWLDHYLKGAPAPAWITEGVPYRGR